MSFVGIKVYHKHLVISLRVLARHAHEARIIAPTAHVGGDATIAVVLYENERLFRSRDGGTKTTNRDEARIVPLQNVLSKIRRYICMFDPVKIVKGGLSERATNCDRRRGYYSEHR